MLQAPLLTLMMIGTPLLIAIIVVFVACITLTVWGILSSPKKPEIIEDSADWTPPEPIAIGARVVGLCIETGTRGTFRNPTYGSVFTVTFLTDDGERVEYEVPEDVYINLTEDQTGTLVILNGKFFAFGDGEEVADTPENTAEDTSEDAPEI